MQPDHHDVIVVGAGISGISAGYHLQRHCPDREFAILEARDAIGGTWDLFRYPGVRSDSDMHTLGFHFRPWTGARAIADGESIRRYIADTAAAFGLDRRIRFGHRLRSAAWSSEAARWTLQVDAPQGRMTLTCEFLMMCGGYYDYARGHAPAFEGQESFAGRIVHPQFWPADLEIARRRIVVIGSGATAVTLVPALVERGAQVTMLQRSPSYIVARPSEDALAVRLGRWLPQGLAYRLTRWKNVALGSYFYWLARRRPALVRRRLLAMVRGELGPGHDIRTHFTPRYDPWDQRLCLAPDGDFFAALRSGHAAVATGAIDRFERDGVRLASGEFLPADLIVTATGLELQLVGAADLSIDGAPVSLAGRLQYRGMMFEGVPNLSVTFGYTNASWTLKADLVSRQICRLLNAMRRRGVHEAVPINAGGPVAAERAIALDAGYVLRAAGRLPVQGDRRPWRLHQSYLRDWWSLRLGRVGTAMRFAARAPSRKQRA